MSSVYHSMRFDKCRHLCNPNLCESTEHDYQPRKFSLPLPIKPHSHPTETTTVVILHVWVWSVTEVHINVRIIQNVCVSFYARLLSWWKAKWFWDSSMLVHVSVVCFFLLLTAISLYVSMLLLMDTRADSRWGAIINKAAILLQDSL